MIIDKYNRFAKFGLDWKLQMIFVLVEPYAGNSDDYAKQELIKIGAIKVTILTHGFISAEIPRDKISAIEQFAHVHIKRISQPNK